MPDEINLPRPLVGKTTEDVNDVWLDLVALRDKINGAIAAGNIANGSVSADKLSPELASTLGVNTGGVTRRASLYLPQEEQRVIGGTPTVMPTADRVTVSVPAGGVLAVLYSAIAKSAAANGYAGLFVGENQLKVARSGFGPEPEAAWLSNTAYGYLSTFACGLVSTEASPSAYPGHLPGQVFGAFALGFGQLRVNLSSINAPVSPESLHGFDALGGPCRFFGLAPGSYDVSVRYWGPPGVSLFAKERRLVAWVEGY